MPVNSVGNSDWYIGSNKLGSNSVITGKDASELKMEDFFSLLVAQMTNQDMLNPQADTDYIAQMAQFTTLQGIKTIQEYQLSSYAASYAGKYVAIAHTSESGNLTKTEGLVSGVTFYDGEPKVVVNGVSYPLYSVMEVKSGPSESAVDETEADDDVAADGITLDMAAAYIGKVVTVNFKNGEYTEEVSGRVASVSKHENGKVQVVIDGNYYFASNIVAIEGQEIDGN